MAARTQDARNATYQKAKEIVAQETDNHVNGRTSQKVNRISISAIFKTLGILTLLAVGISGITVGSLILKNIIPIENLTEQKITGIASIVIGGLSLLGGLGFAGKECFCNILAKLEGGSPEQWSAAMF